MFVACTLCSAAAGNSDVIRVFRSSEGESNNIQICMIGHVKCRNGVDVVSKPYTGRGVGAPQEEGLRTKLLSGAMRSRRRVNHDEPFSNFRYVVHQGEWVCVEGGRSGRMVMIASLSGVDMPHSGCSAEPPK